MTLTDLLREIEGRGVTLFPTGDQLRFCPKRNLTPELVEALREHKAAILEGFQGPEETPQIGSVGEVLEAARAYFGLRPEDREAPPSPPPENCRDPLVQRHTAKARFFRGVHKRDLEKRRREGLPPWIWLVDGGGGAA